MQIVTNKRTIWSIPRTDSRERCCKCLRVITKSEVQRKQMWKLREYKGY